MGEAGTAARIKKSAEFCAFWVLPMRLVDTGYANHVFFGWALAMMLVWSESRSSAKALAENSRHMDIAINVYDMDIAMVERLILLLLISVKYKVKNKFRSRSILLKH
jgi:hypothetical protein